MSRLFVTELLAFDRAPGGPFAREIFAMDRDTMREFDADGRMHVEVCNLSKATVNGYYGREIPNATELGLDPTKLYRLYRDPMELESGAMTFNNLQLLDLHTPVNADDPKMSRTCGCIGSDVRFEAPYLKGSLAVWTAPAIAAVLSKKSAQLSCSYRYRADMTPGVTSGGLAYDGVMRDIIGNHVALVAEGRAGPDVFVSDSIPIFEGIETMKFPKLVALLSSVVPMTAEQKLACDAALVTRANDEEKDDKADDAFGREEATDEREAACDAREEAMDAELKDPGTEVAKGDRKKARDARAKDRAAAKDKRAADKAAADAKRGKDSDPVLEAEEKKLKGGAEDGAITRAVDAALKAGGYVTAEAAQKMANDAVSKTVNLDKAKREVAPLVGQIVVAMDSAEAVYRFALDKAGVAHKDVHESALSALVSAEVRARKGAPRAAPVLAADGVRPSVASIFAAPAGK